ncbi:MAG: ADOP family duplicated permease [Gemmatimonadaceae bacterium]
MSNPFRRRFFQLPWRSADRIQADVDEELRAELDERARELMESGCPEQEARRRALEDFGDFEATRRYCAELDRAGDAEERRAELLGELRQDVRFAWRGMRRTPGFALVVLITLALGIGATTAVFSVVRQVLIDRLPYAAPGQLVLLYGATDREPGARGMVSATEISDVAHQSTTLSAIAPFGNHAGYTYVSDREADMWAGTSVGPAFFRTLGAPALLGRTIDERDVEATAIPVVVLSYALWQRAFGGDSGVVGRKVRLNGVLHTVIGVMPPTFISPARAPEAWLPLDLSAVLRGPTAAGRVFGAIGRMASDATVARARAELDAIARQRPETSPDPNVARSMNPVPIRDAMVGGARPVLLVVMGAAALVLLVACVNVAGLFLARAMTRRRELAVRAALGAGRGRLVRQLLTESAMLGLAGGAIGIALAFWVKDILVGVAGRLLQPIGDVRVDGGVLAFAVILSLASGLGFGLLPAVLAARTDLNAALAESSRGAVGGQARTRTGRLLVAGQMALAVVLLIGAGLLGRTLVALERTDVGYSTAPQVLTFRINLGPEYADAARQTSFFSELLARLRALPGVGAAGMIAISPWNGPYPARLVVEGRSEPTATAPPVALHASASDGYFAAVGIPLRAGRAFTPSDREGSLPVALISESLARKYWPGATPIGARICVGPDDAPWRQVVGVVGDVRASALSDAAATVYVPAWQDLWRGNELVVRTTGDGMTLVPAIRREVRDLDPTLPLVTPQTMDDVSRTLLASQRLPMLFTSAFAALALVLAALGVYGVTAYTVTTRTREFGIRTALGGRRGSILWLVMRHGLATAVAGTIVGLAIAAAASRSLAGLLFGVTPHDVATFVAAPLVLIAVSIAACLLPARRATLVNPVDVLHSD